MFVFQQAAHPPGRGGAGPPRLEHVEVSVRSGEPVQSSLNFVEDLKFRLDVLVKPPCFPILFVFLGHLRFRPSPCWSGSKRTDGADGSGYDQVAPSSRPDIS